MIVKSKIYQITYKLNNTSHALLKLKDKVNRKKTKDWWIIIKNTHIILIFNSKFIQNLEILSFKAKKMKMRKDTKANNQ